MDETYHSRNGAVSESIHVFIKEGLGRIKDPEPKVLEIGFGTGLNALLTCLHSMRSKSKVHYTGLEPFPLDLKLIEQLNYSQFISDEACSEIQQKIHQSKWDIHLPYPPSILLN